MSEQPTPQSEAERIRNKRLARLGGGTGNTSSTSNPSSPPAEPTAPAPNPSTSTAAPKSVSPKANTTASPTQASKSSSLPGSSSTGRVTPSRITITKPIAQETHASNSVPKPKHSNVPFSFARWEEDTVEIVFGVALDKDIAQRKRLVWLKELSQELISETPESPRPLRCKGDHADQILIGRLELDPQRMSDDPEQISIMSSIPPEQTCFEYLVGCWKRLIGQRAAVIKRAPPEKDLEKAIALIEKLRELIISYCGLTMQDPSMFPQPNTTKPLGGAELLPPLFALASANSVFSATSPMAQDLILDPSSELQPFLSDLAKRFHQDGLEEVLGGVVRSVAFSPHLAVGMVHTTATLSSTAVNPTSWRSAVAALECLFSIKPIAAMITTLPQWNPDIWNQETRTGVKNGSDHEKSSILGMVMRLGIFARDWPAVLVSYYKDFDQMPPRDKQASDISLKASLTSLRTSLYNMVNSIVRAGPAPREAFLAYVGRVVALNGKRAAMRFKYETQASDSFMHNLHYVLLRLADPFMMDYQQLDKIDLRYYERSRRIVLKDQTRINATPPEIEEWEKGADAGGPTPNFVSDVFYLLTAVNHLSTGPISNYISAIARHVRDIEKELEVMERDESWRGGPAQQQVEAALKRGKEEISKMHALMESMYVAILDDEFTSKSVGFSCFVSVWLLRMVDPSKQHPKVTISLPLPQEVPLVFKVQPEYAFDDIVEFWDLMMKYKPTVFTAFGQKEIIDFAIAFLTSTWYITNPYLKSKLVAVLAIGVRPFRQHTAGILGNALCSHPLSLKHLMMCLMSFYVECEKTGTHTQFYDKFRERDIAEVMQSVWRDSTHRAVMANFTSNMQEFVKFANRLMNDVTFMLDELLTKLAEIKKLQLEMANKEAWEALTQEQREDRTSKLRAAEGIVESWVIYSREFLALLIEFTDSSKAPFVSPEIVGRLAAMLNYVLDQLAGPRASDLKTKDLDKYRFDPREMLSKVLQIYINLSGEPAFVQAVAGEGRSYRKSLFDRALKIARDKVLKSSEELETFAKFAENVEATRLAMDEEEITDYPEEFEDPLMATIMKDPVILPSSKTVVDMSTIKSHLLSDPTDPFNRMPLKIEDVIPNTELKARIDAFLSERRNNIVEERIKSAADENQSKMDIAE
ncbi:related to UFD2-ubiquitin fusion degradation protein [Serendipita indica DSM 11827]|uniref:RING-type E3 ubiquitin transferase n=1 Tax=Serendipita indica (strain DSM 11827) TaxID=1109443 RepID=G4TR10_SERID|nr:related to UFD2-ubiquitin fusion degradation protein [Serendipita indica DSM 11827]